MKYLICSKDKQKNIVEKFIFLLCVLFLVGYTSDLQGQTRPLDNWDLEVIGKKELQSETYLSFTKRGPFNTNTYNTLLRYGIKKNYELQVSWRGTKAENNVRSEVSQNTRIGLKAHLFDDTKYLPGISLIASLNLTPYLKENPLEPALNILFRKGLASNFTLTGNYQFILDEQNSNLSNDFALNLDVELTNWLTSYVGIKGVKTHPDVEGQALYQEYVEWGMLIWIADKFRIYPYYDFGLANDSDDIINLGFLYHFN